MSGDVGCGARAEGEDFTGAKSPSSTRHHGRYLLRGSTALVTGRRRPPRKINVSFPVCVLMIYRAHRRRDSPHADGRLGFIFSRVASGESRSMAASCRCYWHCLTRYAEQGLCNCWASVRPSVCLSVPFAGRTPLPQLCCRGPAGGRYRSIAARRTAVPRCQRA